MQKKINLESGEEKRMNKWKIAFWICLFALVITGLFGLYGIIDQGVTLTYMKEGYTDTENDLATLIDVINKTNLTKSEIEETIKDHRLYEFMDFNSDTVALERVELYFKNDTLNKVQMQW